MVNFLEALYVVTALSFAAALVLLIKGRRLAARRAIVGATCAVLAIVLYWYLSASA
jgi:hypothetical protein